MANVRAVIDFVLEQEDRGLSGAVTTLKGDTGGMTRFGIAAKFHPELIGQGFFTPFIVDKINALVIAEKVYTSQYANGLKIASINDQRLATALFSFGLNAGIGTAAKILQEACCRFGQHVSRRPHRIFLAASDQRHEADGLV